MSDPTAHIQWIGTSTCLDFGCPKCGTSGHYHTDGHAAIACIGCGERYQLGRVEVTPLGSQFDRGAALPVRGGLTRVCERMDKAGGLTDDEYEAVSMVLDAEFGADQLPTWAKRAILEWAKEHDDE